MSAGVGSILQILGLLSLLAQSLLANPDKYYKSEYPFRPQNVSGLTGLYNNVGSYYNATALLEFTPLYGPTASQLPCENARGKTFTHEFQSILIIAERGPYNTGPNSINLYLTLWKSGVNFSSFSNETDKIWDLPSLEWFLESSSWSDSADGYVESDGQPPTGTPVLGDIFNLTLSQTSKTPYNLTGQVVGLNTLNALDINLASCNTSLESDRFIVNLIDGHWSGTEGWNWTYPQVKLQFDAVTANLSVDGGFLSTPYLLSNSTDSTRGPVFGPGSDVIQGTVKIRVSGSIDQYHSDVLVNDSSIPTWLRTVGFQNNSANIGYTNATSGWVDVGPRFWAAAMVSSCLIICLKFF